jgi:hypothetical protein
MVSAARRDQTWQGGRVPLWLLLADLTILAVAWILIAIFDVWQTREDGERFTRR